MSADDEKIYTLDVVTIGGVLRCVYVENYRLVGSKPYVSERGTTESRKFSLTDLRDAFPELKITKPRPRPSKGGKTPNVEHHP